MLPLFERAGFSNANYWYRTASADTHPIAKPLVHEAQRLAAGVCTVTVCRGGVCIRCIGGPCSRCGHRTGGGCVYHCVPGAQHCYCKAIEHHKGSDISFDVLQLPASHLLGVPALLLTWTPATDGPCKPCPWEHDVSCSTCHPKALRNSSMPIPWVVSAAGNPKLEQLVALHGDAFQPTRFVSTCSQVRTGRLQPSSGSSRSLIPSHCAIGRVSFIHAPGISP